MPKPLFLLLALAVPGFAAVTPAPLFTSHAVLQQETPVPIWGTADPGEKITVRYNGQEHSTTADADGRWMVRLDPLPAGTAGPLTISGQNTVTLEDVISGEVWLCSGQSNMAFTVQRAKDAEAEIAAANHPGIRMFVTKTNFQGTPQTVCEGQWQICSPATVGGFSATAYFFGRELNQVLKKPVGLIVSAVGGTQIELWISREGHEKLGTAAALDAEAEKARTSPADATQSQQEKSKNKKKAFAVGGLYNGMIAPLIPYALHGAIWYQGEANSNQGKTRYDAFLNTLIADWRTRWSDEFPFGWVQLPEFQAPQTLPVEDGGWTLLREAMLRTLKTPKTGMAIALGLGEADDIHPKNKQDVGKRLALWALGDVYRQKVAASSGPLPESHKITGSQIEVTFSHADGGLAATNGELKGFAIAGDDRKWVWAEARIDGNRVIASSPEVPKPVAVRYAWADNPVFSLVNGAGLPASPFRTDTFPPNPLLKRARKAAEIQDPPPSPAP